MADTALNFGPEWLRALTDHGPSGQQQGNSSGNAFPNSGNSGLPPRTYKLAEFRYGREEMLALFNESSKLSDELRKEFPTLTTETCQPPLALVPMTEEEHQLYARSVNSDAVLRLMQSKDRGGAPGLSSPLGERVPPGDRRDGLRRGVNIPGGSRGGRDNRPGYYGKGSYDDRDEADGDRREGNYPGKFGRTNSTSEDKSRFEDRNPRSQPSWRTPSKDDRGNWRTRDKDDGWRSSNSRPSWRDERDERDDRYGSRHRSSHSFSRDWDGDGDDGQNLPDWCLDDDDGATVGTFDATGAFREGSEEDSKEDLAGGEWQTAGQPRSSRNNSATAKTQKPTKNEPSENSDNRNDPNAREDQRLSETNSSSKEFVRRESNNNSTLQANSNNSNKLDNNMHRYQNEPRQPSQSVHSGEQQQPASSKAALMDEEGLSHLEKEAESMVARWTSDEEHQHQRSSKQSHQPQFMAHEERPEPSVPVFLPPHEDAFKWFYRDPQGQIQGPFSSRDMLDWYTAGYFQMNLLVRRGCDDKFHQLGELMKLYDRVPFAPDTPQIQPIRTHPQVPQQQPAQQQVPLQPQLNNSVPPEHPLLATSSGPQSEYQMRQLLLNQQQQQAQRQRMQQLQMQHQLRELLAHLKNQEGFSDLPQQQQQEILVRQYAQLEATRRQMQAQPLTPNIPVELEHSAALMHGNTQQMVNRSVPMMPTAQPPTSVWEINGAVSAAQLEELHRKEEQERKERELERQRKLMEEEHRRRLEAEEAEKQQAKLAEEAEKRRLLELHRREEEARRQQQEEQQRRRQEEIRRLEDIARKQQEEVQRKHEEERLRQLQLKQQQEQQQQRKGWGSLPATSQPAQPAAFTGGHQNVSLADIQKMEEERERERRKAQEIQQQQMQALFQAQMQQQQSKQLQMTWASNNNAQSAAPVKTLDQIQREEAERLAKQKQKEKELRALQPEPVQAGIWSNAASRIKGWDNSTSTSNSTSSYWAQQPPEQFKAASAFNSTSNKTQNANSKSATKAKKHEETVHGLFERRSKHDEFTAWCEDTLSKYQKTVDVPTFVTFLKDIESPYDITDYVRSYLGDNKESRDFAKQFLEKRSFYRNKAKQQSTEELMWGPAPAITPSVNKATASSANSNNNQVSAVGDAISAEAKAGKGKKKKSKRVDNSLLGFTVQADPDRINAGEIEHLE